MALNRNWAIWIRHSFSFMFDCFLASSTSSNLIYEETWKDKRRMNHKLHQFQQEQEGTSARWAVPNHPHDLTATGIFEVFHGIIYIWWFFFSSFTAQTNEGYFRSSQWQELFTLFSCIALGSELHHDFCGIFIKIHSEETQILKNCYMTPSTRQLRAEPEGNHTQGESKIHLKILKAKLQRGRERTDIFLLRQNEVADLLGMFVLPKFQQDNFAQN